MSEEPDERVTPEKPEAPQRPDKPPPPPPPIPNIGIPEIGKKRYTF